MSRDFGSWAGFASGESLDSLVNYICTGQNSKTVTPHAQVGRMLAGFPEGSRVLDFGCGVCRNAIEFANAMPHLDFVGYDSEQMLVRADEFCRHRYGHPVAEVQNLHLTANWSAVSSSLFECVYATIVFQHIPPDQLSAYIDDIKRCAKRLIVYGRRYNDFSGGSTWSVLESAGLFPANAAECGYKAEGDPHEHLPACVYVLE